MHGCNGVLQINMCVQVLSSTIGASYTNFGAVMDITGLAISETAYDYEAFLALKVMCKIRERSSITSAG